MRADSARSRLNTALTGLRAAGLAGILQTAPDGYLLAPSVAVLVVDE